MIRKKFTFADYDTSAMHRLKQSLAGSIYFGCVGDGMY